MVLIIFAATKGYLDKIKISAISDFEQGLLKEVDLGLLKTIKEEKAISDSTQQKLTAFCDSYTTKFMSTQTA